MTSAQIEKWILDVVDRVRGGKPSEDFRVELKTEWPAPDSIVRQLAAHANAARGESILWIVGVNEREHAVPGVTARELATWKPQLDSGFDGIGPELLWDGVVPVGDVAVVGLLFSTTRVPYVIKRQTGVEFEVPWREGTRTRSARREDLIRLLVPISTSPSVELVEAHLRGGASQAANRKISWDLVTKLYFVIGIDKRAVLPFHNFTASAVNTHLDIRFPGLNIIYPQANNVGLIRADHRQLIVDGPGMVELRLGGETDGFVTSPDPVRMHLRWMPVHSIVPVEVNVLLEPKEGLHWAYQQT